MARLMGEAIGFGMAVQTVCDTPIFTGGKHHCVSDASITPEREYTDFKLKCGNAKVTKEKKLTSDTTQITVEGIALNRDFAQFLVALYGYTADNSHGFGFAINSTYFIDGDTAPLIPQTRRYTLWFKGLTCSLATYGDYYIENAVMTELQLTLDPCQPLKFTATFVGSNLKRTTLPQVLPTPTTTSYPIGLLASAYDTSYIEGRIYDSVLTADAPEYNNFLEFCSTTESQKATIKSISLTYAREINDIEDFCACVSACKDLKNTITCTAEVSMDWNCQNMLLQDRFRDDQTIALLFKIYQGSTGSGEVLYFQLPKARITNVGDIAMTPDEVVSLDLTLEAENASGYSPAPNTNAYFSGYIATSVTHSHGIAYVSTATPTHLANYNA